MYLALEPAGSGQLKAERRSRVERTSSPYDVVEAFSGLAETSEKIDTDQLTQLADHPGRPDPEHPRGVPERARGLSALSANVAARDEQINTLLSNLRRVSGVLDDRDEDIVTLMKDSDVLFRRWSRAARRSTTCWSPPRAVQRADRAGPAEPGRPQAGADQPRARGQVLHKNQDNLDNTLRLMAPFYRVFANTLGNGPWFDTYIYNLPRARSRRAGWLTMELPCRSPSSRLIVLVARRGGRAVHAVPPGDDQKTLTAQFPRTISLYEGSRRPGARRPGRQGRRR